jgi:hypothetical protein
MTSSGSWVVPRSHQENADLPSQVVIPSFHIPIYTIIRCRPNIVTHCIKLQHIKGNTSVIDEATKIIASFDRKCTVFINVTSRCTNAMLNEVLGVTGVCCTITVGGMAVIRARAGWVI